MPKKTIKTLIIIVGLIIISASSYAGIEIWKDTKRLEKEKDIVLVNQLKKKPEIKESEVTEIDTSDWKTYRNEEYGFEVKYPKEWLITNSISRYEGIYISPPYNYLYSICYISGCVNIVVLHNPRHFDVKEFYRLYSQKQNNLEEVGGLVYPLNESEKIEYIQVGGVRALKFSEYLASGEMITISVPYKDIIIELNLKGYNSYKENRGKEKLLMETVRSLKFLDTIEKEE